MFVYTFVNLHHRYAALVASQTQLPVILTTNKQASTGVGSVSSKRKRKPAPSTKATALSIPVAKRAKVRPIQVTTRRERENDAADEGESEVTTVQVDSPAKGQRAAQVDHSRLHPSHVCLTPLQSIVNKNIRIKLKVIDKQKGSATQVSVFKHFNEYVQSSS